MLPAGNRLSEESDVLVSISTSTVEEGVKATWHKHKGGEGCGTTKLAFRGLRVRVGVHSGGNRRRPCTGNKPTCMACALEVVTPQSYIPASETKCNTNFGLLLANQGWMTDPVELHIV